MQWSGTSSPSGLNDQRRQARAQSQVWTRIDRDLAEDPAFQVRSVDGQRWICPYTLLEVPCPPGTNQPIRLSLYERQPWTGRGRPRPLHQVLVARWQQHLLGAGNTDARLGMFNAAGQWRNPFTATWVTLPVPCQRLDADAIRHVAQVLAGSAEAQQAAMTGAWAESA